MTSQAGAHRTDKETVGFVGGFLTIFAGMRVVYVDHRELAKWYLPPMILSFFFILGAWLLFWRVADDAVAWVWPEPDMAAWWGLLHMAWRGAAVVLWASMAVLTAISSLLIFSLFAAPFADIISENVEGIMGTWDPRPFSLVFLAKDVAAALSLEIMRFGVKAMWLVPLFLLSLLVPVVGHALYLFVGGYFLSKYTGMDYIDWCAARRGWPWRERLAFAAEHRFAVVGFGAAVLLSLMVPLLFVAVWPAAVAGGTVLFLRLTGARYGATASKEGSAPSIISSDTQ